MKIYMPLWVEDPHLSPNPYISTLTDEIASKHKHVEFYYGLELFWLDKCEVMDVVHIMWPNCFDVAMKSGANLRQRFDYLKCKGVKIFCTCHNWASHIQHNEYSNETYSICYEKSDVIIHLGNYSKAVQEQQYPNAKHIIIPHHVYNKLYLKVPTQKDSLCRLGLSYKKKYILCFGAFRNNKEIQFVVTIAKEIRKEGYEILAPSMRIKPVGHKNPVTWFRYYLDLLKYSFYGIRIIGKYVNDEDLPYYYGASDLSLIQRPQILNSGNLPLGMYMGKVVVGPCVGNVGELLAQYGNPSYDPDDISSAISAIRDGFMLCSQGKGEENREYSLENFSTEIIAEKHWNCYNEVI